MDVVVFRFSSLAWEFNPYRCVLPIWYDQDIENAVEQS